MRSSTGAPRKVRMPKVFCIVGMVVAGLLGLLFLLDLALSFPFGRASLPVDIAFVICAAVLGYLSWSTWREQV
jgi:hypothetical protein